MNRNLIFLFAFMLIAGCKENKEVVTIDIFETSASGHKMTKITESNIENPST